MLLNIHNPAQKKVNPVSLTSPEMGDFCGENKSPGGIFMLMKPQCRMSIVGSHI